ncbi:unnamed protein product [Adineta steineri]|uniref:NAD(P)(+)--arginine ADP-ribosyltransferase n=1 Tax=Adineta steineri TaxID=433720 RepID=A0A818WC92_9BILA|nr:unnamed protein product [Adineta steineri]CAF1293549.1 unnamed protein product [Adineta steineri]CAF3516027.1 unnamed protein product [Adineta steineri]CAF3723523.1 unnamed protein product [Adineta steineri]
MDSRPSKPSVKPSHDATASYVRRPRQRMTQNYLLAWVDSTIDQADKDCQDTLVQLKNVINDVNLCTEPNQCIQALNKADKERAFVIASGSLGQHLVPEIHDIPQLDAIYIFCDDISRHEEWIKNWTKVKGVHTNIQEICQALQLAVKQYDQDTIPVSFLTLDDMASPENFNQLEPTFMYTQLFKEILLDIKYGPRVIQDLAVCCREVFSGNSSELQLIHEFERNYRPQKAIWWYTRECFTYKMLNQALRIMDADIMINMGFFLRDVHQQIKQLHEQQVSSYERKPFLVYRGQGLMQSDLEILHKAKGGLISFNNFLSTSTDDKVSLSFAQNASTEPNKAGILFIMSIDPCLKSTPFASIKGESYFKEEAEILFSMHTVFRVSAVKQMDNKKQLYQVELQLTSDDDQQLRLLTDRIRKEVAVCTGWRRLGKLLLTAGQFNKAEELYYVLLEQTSDEGVKQHYYNQLGYVKHHQGDYEKAIWYYKKALEIDQKTVRSNHSDLAASYNNTGSVYQSMGEHSKALSFYEKAREIWQKTLPSNDPSLAASYNNIGSVYDKMEEYSKALSYHEKTLEIWQTTLPSNHPSLAASYNNIGSVYQSMGEHSKALSFYEKAREIWQKTLPLNHPDMANSYNNTGSMYYNMGEYSKALSYYEKVLEIKQETLPSNHPDLASSYNSIGSVYYKMEEYSKALSFYEKVLEIKQETLPSNHPDLATSYNNTGSMYYKMEEYSKALSYYEKALEIRQNTLPSNHPSLAASYNITGSMYYNMGEYSKALSYYEKALEIRQETLPSNHPDLATSYNISGSVYYKMEEYSKALSYYEKALEIKQETLPSNHLHLAALYNNIGCVYKNMKHYSKALSYYERTLDITQCALPPTHPNIKITKEHIEFVKKNL